MVKDPRISKLLPLWLQLLADINVDIVVVITFRNPLEVAASLEKRDHMPLATSLLLYFSSYLKAEMASRDCRRCFVNYAHVVGDWRVLESRLRSILGSRLPMLDKKRLAANTRAASKAVMALLGSHCAAISRLSLSIGTDAPRRAPYAGATNTF